MHEGTERLGRADITDLLRDILPELVRNMDVLQFEDLGIDTPSLAALEAETVLAIASR